MIISSISWLFMSVSLTSSLSCTPPVLDGEVREITASDLAAQYRDDPVAAGHAFTGQTVQVLVRACVPKEQEIHWKILYTDVDPPPTIIFRFDSPQKIKMPCWIEGKCEGAKRDGVSRGVSGYTFTVLVTGCRVVSRSTPTEP